MSMWLSVIVKLADTSSFESVQKGQEYAVDSNKGLFNKKNISC